MDIPHAASTTMLAIETSSHQSAAPTTAASPPSIANLHEDDDQDDAISTHTLDTLESAVPGDLASTTVPASDNSCQPAAVSAAGNSDLTTSTTAAANDDAGEEIFTLFPKFPIELRLKIWKLSFPGPRRVQIRFKKGDLGYCAELAHNRQISALISRSHIPAVLHVSNEARLEARKHYQLCFGIGEHPAAVDFNFDLNTLYIGILPPQERDGLIDEVDNAYRLDGGDWEFGPLMKHGDLGTLDRVRHFAISTYTVKNLSGYTKGWKDHVLKSSGLEEITEIYTEDDSVNGREYGSDVDPDEEIEGTWSGISMTWRKPVPAGNVLQLKLSAI